MPTVTSRPTESPREFVIPDKSEHHTLEKDVAYGEVDGWTLTYHFYRPAHAEAPTPAILFVHGGGFVQGDPSQGAGYGLSYARRGIATFATTYRLAPTHRFPGSVHDTRHALRYLKANAEHFHIDPDRIVLIGLSAGAYLVVMAHLSRGVAELTADHFPAELQSVDEDIRGVIAHYGPFDLRAGPMKTLRGVYLPKDKRHDDDYAALASPITHVQHAAVPIQLIHGTHDKLVPIKESESLHAALQKAGKRTEFHPIDGAEHGFQVNWRSDQNRASNTHMKRFLSEVLDCELQ